MIRYLRINKIRTGVKCTGRATGASEILESDPSSGASVVIELGEDGFSVFAFSIIGCRVCDVRRREREEREREREREGERE